MKTFITNVGALVAARNLLDATNALSPTPTQQTVVIADPEPAPMVPLLTVTSGQGRAPGSRKYTGRSSRYTPHQGAREIARRLKRSQP